jgi:hypothetical protein
MQGWIGVIAGGMGFTGGVLSVRWRALVHGRLAVGQALWLLMLGLGAATILRNSVELGGWTGGGLAATEIVQDAFGSAFVALGAVFVARRSWAKRRSGKTKKPPVAELRARFESLLRDNENELQTLSRRLEDSEALDREMKALAAGLRAGLESGSTAAGSPTALREAVAALDASVARSAAATRELRSVFEAGLAATDRLKAAIAARATVGPLTELDEAAFDTLIDRARRELDRLRPLDEENRRILDRAFESVAEAKAQLAELAPPV